MPASVHTANDAVAQTRVASAGCSRPHARGWVEAFALTTETGALPTASPASTQTSNPGRDPTANASPSPNSANATTPAAQPAIQTSAECSVLSVPYSVFRV